MFDPDTQIRPATLEDADRLLLLINTIQPHVPWNYERLKWQFFDGPAGPAEVSIVEIDGRIVALYVAVPYSMVTPSADTSTGWMIQDVMTHPDYRGQGILHELGARSLQRIRRAGDFGFCFPNENSAGSFRRNGWYRLCGVPLRTLDLSSASSMAPMELQPVDGAIDLSIPRLPVSYGVDRTSRYLDWRYSKPGQKYQFYSVGDAEGYVVLKPYRRDEGLVMHVCDIMLTSAELVPRVVAAIIDIAQQSGARLLTLWMTPGHPYAEHFDSMGLGLDNQLPVSVYVTGPEPQSSQFTDAGSWHITHGDSDVF